MIETKKEVIDKIESMRADLQKGYGNQGFHDYFLQKVLIEVLIDMRDQMVEINRHLKEIDSAAQIYREINPI